MLDGFPWPHARDELNKHEHKAYRKEWIQKANVLIICLIVFIYMMSLIIFKKK